MGAATTPWKLAPVFVLEDNSGTAKALDRQLSRSGHQVQHGSRVTHVRRYLSQNKGHRAVFVIDIKLGKGLEREGLKAIQLVADSRKEHSQESRIFALTSHHEYESQARDAGADDFLIKHDNHRDALTVQLLLEQQDVQGATTSLDKTRRALAQGEYEELEQKLKSKAPSYSQILASVERALSWPGLPDLERLVLGSLHGPLTTAEREGKLTPTRRSVLSQGTSLLRKLADPGCKIGDSEIDSWITRLLKECPDAIATWPTEDGELVPEIYK